MSRLPSISPGIGDALVEVLEITTGQEVDIILMVFPRGDNPQPEFVTSYHPELMESVIKQVAEQMTPDFVKSRVEDDGKRH